MTAKTSMRISTPSTSPQAPTPSIPYRQIRAAYDSDTIVVYQAYSSSIALPAVAAQKLNASPAFKPTRMTWLKPSWAWMMYRSGYSFKDPGQERILAIKMTHANFRQLLLQASVTGHGEPMTAADKAKPAVRVQWDPERSIRLAVLPYRSIQIGVSGEVGVKWVEEWIDGIEDVTDMARRLKQVLDEEAEVREGELIRRDLMPREKVYELDEGLRTILRMDER
ncbi:MAG: hypothetical protein LQ349_004954 [Xanthoria aureola]|nr:MAG: hypothetical protein LQ349_004954 [Xanthoria aureola]